MKFTKFIVAALALVAGLTACVEEPEAPSPVIKLGEQTITLEAAGDSQTVGYMVENPVEGEKISIACEAEWLTVNSAKMRTLEFTAPLNESGEERSVDVVLSYKGAENVILKVTQLYHESPLKIELTEITATEVVFSVTTDDKNLTWMPIIYTKELHDYLATDDAVHAFDIEYLEYTAENRDESLEDFLEDYLAVGSVEDIFFDGLEPNTAYVLHAYGMDTKGVRTTEMIAVEFTTEVAWTGDITVEFEAEEKNHVVYFNATPSHTGVPYFCHYATEQEINRWKQQYGTDDMKTLVQQGCINALMQGLIEVGFAHDASGFFALFNNTGRIRDGYFPCKAGTKYTFFAGKWDKECQLVGELSTYEFETAPVEPSNNKITLALGRVTQSTAVISTYTTNSDPYAIAALESEAIAGMTDEEIFEYADAHRFLSEFTFSGNKTREFSSLTPNTDYTFVAFGYKAESMTTESISKVEFRTLSAGRVEDCTFEFEWDVREESIWIKVTPSDNGYHYYCNVYDARFTSDDVKTYISETLVGGGYEGDFAAFASWWLRQGVTTDEVTGIYPGTEYKIGVVIMDMESGEFLTDVIFSDVFKTPELEYSDITMKLLYDKYYDLDALSAAGYPEYKESVSKDSRFDNGGAVLPVSVSITGDYQQYYYYIVRNDLTNTDLYDDNMFYRDMVTKGMGSSNPAEDFVISYGSDWTLVALAIDKDGNRTPTFRQLVKALNKNGASPASEFAPVESKSSAPKQSAVKWTSFQSVAVERVSDENGRRNYLLSRLPHRVESEESARAEFLTYSVR